MNEKRSFIQLEKEAIHYDLDPLKLRKTKKPMARLYKEEVELLRHLKCTQKGLSYIRPRARANPTPVGVIASVTHHTYYIQAIYFLLGLRPDIFCLEN